MNLLISGNEILFKSTDGGNTWQELTTFGNNIFNLQFFNINLGWATTYNRLHKTTNGGNTWNQQAQPISSYFFISGQIGWYVNNNEIFHSTNGGNNWILQNSNTTNELYNIFFLDNNNGWAVGENGTILHTNNGGIPVELINLTATIFGNEVILNWTTASETNNRGFEILRSSQNYNNEWETIGFVNGHGTTTELQFYSFTDESVTPGKFQYRLKQIDFDGNFEFSEVVEVEIGIPKEFSLEQNYPNPFNPSTNIGFQIASFGFVTLKVYDILGNEIATLVNEEKPAGEYEVEFDGSELTSGIYFYKLISGNYVETKKMIIIK